MRREPRGKQGAAVRLRLDSVLALAGERESEAWKRGISPKRWRDDLLHPTIRTDIEAPPGDRLITRAEAAEILGVVPERVGELVRDGRLFGWQKKPGRQGCRLLLSERQVLRYAEDPMRMKRRLAAVEGSAPSELKVGNNWTEWREWHHLVRYTSAHSDRDRGEFLTTAQAALLLGITIRSVQRLRQKGRVQGYRRTNARQSWWFFRREEIENLLADCGYAQGRRTAHKALQTIRARKAEKPAITYSRYRDEDDRR